MFFKFSRNLLSHHAMKMEPNVAHNSQISHRLINSTTDWISTFEMTCIQKTSDIEFELQSPSLCYNCEHRN